MQNEDLNIQLDELRNQQIGILAADSKSADLAAETQKHAITKSLLADYIEQLKIKEAENVKLVQKDHEQQDVITKMREENKKELEEKTKEISSLKASKGK